MCALPIYVHALFHAQVLDRYQTLVVILGDHNVELAFAGPHENRVARPWAADIQAQRACLPDCRQSGRASCRERVCQYVYISVVAVSLKKNNKSYNTN